MKRHPRIPAFCAAAIAGALLLPAAAAYADRKSPLEGQPAVRNRLLLVKERLEVSAAFESSVNADFRHTVSGGLKAEYHLTDMLSIGGVGFFGASFNTGLTGRILDTLPDTSMDGDPTPTALEFEEHLNDMPIHGAAYASVTPWYGKLAAFGSVFVNFDFYFQGGLAFAQLSNDCCSFQEDQNPGGDLDADPPIFPDDDPNDDPAINDGNRLGLYLGGGIHVFMNQWLALDFTVRNYFFNDNPSGLDFDADLAVTGDDNRFQNHLFMGVGLSFFFPMDAERTQ